MTRIRFLLFFFSIVVVADAQTISNLDIPFYKFDNSILPYGNAGGLANPQFGNADFNFDGKEDIYIFDRAGNVNMVFLRNDSTYTYSLTYSGYLPAFKNWVLLRDYNHDGIKDVFTFSGDLTNQGVIVYKGKNIDNHLSFEQVLFPDHDTDVLYYEQLPHDIPIFISWLDYPEVVDVDSDGDFDILTFDQIGVHMYWYKNLAVEEGLGNNGLKFEFFDDCFGRFYENGTSEEIILSDDPDICPVDPNNLELRHSGSTVTAFDNDNDADYELLIGDISYNIINLLTNGGNSDTAFITAQDPNFPSYSTPVEIQTFPLANIVDMDGDSINDLMVSSNDLTFVLGENDIWFYKNVGTNQNPTFILNNQSMFLDQMIDLKRTSIPAFYDYNLDGLLDVIIGNSVGFTLNYGSATLHLYENIGTSTNPEYKLVNSDYLNLSQQNFYGLSPSVGDIDNDGDIDILVGSTYKDLILLRNIGDSDFILDTNYLNMDVGQFPAPFIVDLDRDGLSDIVIGHKNGKIDFYRNTGSTGNESFDTDINALGNIHNIGGVNVQVSSLNPNGDCHPVFYDFEGEYKLFCGSNSGQLFYYDNIENNLEGNFTLVSSNLLPMNIGWLSSPAVADINSNGKVDIFLGNLRGGINTLETNINLDGTVSQHYLNRDLKISIFPNPVQNSVFISGENNFKCHYQIIDITGKQFDEGSIYLNSSLDLSGLPTGLFIIKIYDGINYFFQKLIKID